MPFEQCVGCGAWLVELYKKASDDIARTTHRNLGVGKIGDVDASWGGLVMLAGFVTDGQGPDEGTVDPPALEGPPEDST